MKAAGFPLLKVTQHELCVYSLVIYPDEPIIEKVIAETTAIWRKYNSTPVSIPAPHVTIAFFEARENMENTMIRWIERIFNTTKCFQVTLNNYSVQPPANLFLRILDHKPFALLANNLKLVDQYVRANACPSAHFIRNPHLSINLPLLCDLPVAALMEFSHATFTATFTVNKLTLLRSEASSGTTKAVNVFGLNPNFKY